MIIVVTALLEAYAHTTKSQRKRLQRAYEQALVSMLQQVEREMRAAGEVSQADLAIVSEVMTD